MPQDHRKRGLVLKQLMISSLKISGLRSSHRKMVNRLRNSPNTNTVKGKKQKEGCGKGRKVALEPTPLRLTGGRKCWIKNRDSFKIAALGTLPIKRKL